MLGQKSLTSFGTARDRCSVFPLYSVAARLVLQSLNTRILPAPIFALGVPLLRTAPAGDMAGISRPMIYADIPEYEDVDRGQPGRLTRTVPSDDSDRA